MDHLWTLLSHGMQEAGNFPVPLPLPGIATEAQRTFFTDLGTEGERFLAYLNYQSMILSWVLTISVGKKLWKLIQEWEWPRTRLGLHLEAISVDFLVFGTTFFFVCFDVIGVEKEMPTGSWLARSLASGGLAAWLYSKMAAVVDSWGLRMPTNKSPMIVLFFLVATFSYGGSPVLRAQATIESRQSQVFEELVRKAAQANMTPDEYLEWQQQKSESRVRAMEQKIDAATERQEALNEMAQENKKDLQAAKDELNRAQKTWVEMRLYTAELLRKYQEQQGR